MNGVQHNRGHVFVTSSGRALLLRAQLSESASRYIRDSLTAMAEGVAGDDLASDEGNTYVSNPQQTVLKFPGMCAGPGWRRGDMRVCKGRIRDPILDRCYVLASSLYKVVNVISFRRRPTDQ